MRKFSIVLPFLFLLGTISYAADPAEPKVIYVFAKALKDGSLLTVTKKTSVKEVTAEDVPATPPPGFPAGAKWITGPYEFHSYTFSLDSGQRETFWDTTCGRAKSLKLPDEECMNILDAARRGSDIGVLYTLYGKGHVLVRRVGNDGVWQTVGDCELKETPYGATSGEIAEDEGGAWLIVLKSRDGARHTWRMSGNEAQPAGR